jgi:hypothetical protein
MVDVLCPASDLDESSNAAALINNSTVSRINDLIGLTYSAMLQLSAAAFNVLDLDRLRDTPSWKERLGEARLDNKEVES